MQTGKNTSNTYFRQKRRALESNPEIEYQFETPFCDVSTSFSLIEILIL